MGSPRDEELLAKAKGASPASDRPRMARQFRTDDRLSAAAAAAQASRRQSIGFFCLSLLAVAWLWLGPNADVPAEPIVKQGAAGAPAPAGQRAALQQKGQVVTAAPIISAEVPTHGDTMHTFMTSNGQPYINYQTLVLYGTFLRVQRMPGGEKMVAFTRILHRVADDVLTPAIPTWRSQVTHPGCAGGGGGCRYAPIERPAAVRQFMQAAVARPSLIQAPWIYFIEADFVLVKPVPPPGPAESPDVRPIGYDYGYVAPQAPGLKDIMRKLYPPGLGPLTDIPHSGPSPLLARPSEWARVSFRFEGYLTQMEADPVMVKKLGWVRDMYAFSVGAAVERLRLVTQTHPASRLIAQLPSDESLGNATAFHYTWGCHFQWAANMTTAWRFEKRLYTTEHFQNNLPKVPLPPPWQPGVWVNTSPRRAKPLPTTKSLYDACLLMVTHFNAGIDEVGGPRWKEVLAERAEERYIQSGIK